MEEIRVILLEEGLSPSIGANCSPIGLVTTCIILEEVKLGVIRF